MDGLLTNYTFEPASAGLLAAWHHRMKSAMAKANEIDNKIVEQRTLLRRYCASHVYSRNQTIAYIGADPELEMLLDDFKFYSGEVQRFNAMIQAELAMRTMYYEGG